MTPFKFWFARGLLYAAYCFFVIGLTWLVWGDK